MFADDINRKKRNKHKNYAVASKNHTKLFAEFFD